MIDIVPSICEDGFVGAQCQYEAIQRGDHRCGEEFSGDGFKAICAEDECCSSSRYCVPNSAMEVKMVMGVAMCVEEPPPSPFQPSEFQSRFKPVEDFRHESVPNLLGFPTEYDPFQMEVSGDGLCLRDGMASSVVAIWMVSFNSIPSLLLPSPSQLSSPSPLPSLSLLLSPKPSSSLSVITIPIAITTMCR